MKMPKQYGEMTPIQTEKFERNLVIVAGKRKGISTAILARVFNLNESQVHRIVETMEKACDTPSAD